mmetsp:Transcript_39293/g.103823  ORF Transcript_39293/g.103823 Transcript_39293/m.103823 type:complete len:80 (+) Transcript_39293:892-1131(+)
MGDESEVNAPGVVASLLTCMHWAKSLHVSLDNWLLGVCGHCVEETEAADHSAEAVLPCESFLGDSGDSSRRASVSSIAT